MVDDGENDLAVGGAVERFRDLEAVGAVYGDGEDADGNVDGRAA